MAYFPSPPLVPGSPLILKVSFYFKPLNHAWDRPDAVAWVNTSGTEGIPFSWNSDVKVYQVHSEADDTQVDTFLSESDTRQVGSMQYGEYFATGNSLLTPQGNNHYNSVWNSSATGTVDTPNVPKRPGSGGLSILVGLEK